MAATTKISLTEEQLVQGLKAQDTAAIQALYEQYSGALMGVIIRIIPIEEIAEDLLQDTFLRIWNSTRHYDPSKGRLFTWMMNIARNIAIDKYRSKDFRNGGKNQNIENNVDLINETNEVIFNADTLGIKDMVTKLKPEFNQVLEMVYFKGYTHVETAEELSIPLGTVKTRIRMAIMELRKHFN